MFNFNFLHLLPLVILSVIGIVVGFVVSGESKPKIKKQKPVKIESEETKKEPKRIGLGLAFLLAIPLMIATFIFTIYPNVLAILFMWIFYAFILFNFKYKYILIPTAILLLFLSLIPHESKIAFITRISYPGYKIMDVMASSSCTNSMACILSDTDIGTARIKNSEKDRKTIRFRKDSFGFWHIEKEIDSPYFNFSNGDYVLLKDEASFPRYPKESCSFELPYGLHYYFESTDPSNINSFITKLAYDDNQLILNSEDAERFFLSNESKDKNKDELDISDFRYIVLKIYKINDNEILFFNPKNNQWEPRGANDFYPTRNQYYNSFDYSKAEIFNDYLAFLSSNQEVIKINSVQTDQILEQYKKDCIDYENFVEETIKRFEDEPAFLQLDKIEDSVFKDQLILLKERGFLTKDFEEFEVDRCYIIDMSGDLVFRKNCLEEERVDLNGFESADGSNSFGVTSINGTIIIWDSENDNAYTDEPDISITEQWNKVVVDYADVNLLDELIKGEYPEGSFQSIEEKEYLRANLFEQLGNLKDSNLKYGLTSLKEQELLPLNETYFRVLDTSCTVNNGVLGEDCLASKWLEVKYVFGDKEFCIYFHDDFVYIVNLSEKHIVVKVDDINDVYANIGSSKNFYKAGDLEELRKSGYGTFSREAMENPSIVYLHNEYVYASNSD